MCGFKYLGPGQYYSDPMNRTLASIKDTKNSYKSIFKSKVPKIQCNHNNNKSLQINKKKFIENNRNKENKINNISNRNGRTSNKYNISPRNHVNSSLNLFFCYFSVLTH